MIQAVNSRPSSSFSASMTSSGSCTVLCTSVRGGLGGGSDDVEGTSSLRYGATQSGGLLDGTIGIADGRVELLYSLSTDIERIWCVHFISRA